MVKRYIFFLCLICDVLLVGCNKTEDVDKTLQSMKGYITNKKSGKILVVASVPTNFSSSNGIDEFYNAIWFSNPPKNAKVGQRVEVWYGNVLTSYPGKSEAKKISILPSYQPKDANLSEDEVIRRVLKKLRMKFNGVTVIKTVKFDVDSDVWEVILKQDNDELHFEVKDD
ncbi:MAG: DUF3221 domain-containing protein [Heyndrickxia sp.]